MAAKERTGNRTMTAMEKRRRRSGASGYILFAVIVSLISLVVLVQIRDVKQRLSVYEQQDQALDEQIAAQLERTEELNELEKYVQTKHMPRNRPMKSSGL